MAGWAYSNWGEQQELDQIDQLRAVEARAKARELKRQEELDAFVEARSSLPDQPPAPELLPPKPSAAPKPKAKPVLPSFLQAKRAIDPAGQPAATSCQPAAKRGKVKPPEDPSAAASPLGIARTAVTPAAAVSASGSGVHDETPALRRQDQTELQKADDEEPATGVLASLVGYGDSDEDEGKEP